MTGTQPRLANRRPKSERSLRYRSRAKDKPTRASAGERRGTGTTCRDGPRRIRAMPYRRSQLSQPPPPTDGKSGNGSGRGEEGPSSLASGRRTRRERARRRSAISPRAASLHPLALVVRVPCSTPLPPLPRTRAVTLTASRKARNSLRTLGTSRPPARMTLQTKASIGGVGHGPPRR